MDPKELINNPEQVKALISLLQSLLPKETTVDATPEETTVSPGIEETQVSEINSTPTIIPEPVKKPLLNKFEQMNEFRMHKDDAAIDAKLSKHPPVARIREFEPLTVKCRICGRSEVVSPTLLYDNPSRYKCNNCSTQAG